MKAKTIILVPLITLVAAIVLNAVFHTVIAASFFDHAFSSFGNNVRPIRETNPGLLSLVEFTWVCALFYLLSLNQKGRMSFPKAILGGMMINASVAGTWNFINASMFTVYPSSVILPDMAWHVLVIGPVAGAMIAGLYNKTERTAKAA
jgi:hypothetical protein